jgi:hypothetical protein
LRCKCESKKQRDATAEFLKIHFSLSSRNSVLLFRSTTPKNNFVFVLDTHARERYIGFMSPRELR